MGSERPTVRYWADGYGPPATLTATVIEPMAKMTKAARRMQVFVHTRHWRSLRKQLFHAQKGVCFICGGEKGEMEWARPSLPASLQPTIDHVIPKALRGYDGPGNILCAHSGCNNDKGDRWPTGCELIWLLQVNVQLGFKPQEW